MSVTWVALIFFLFAATAGLVVVTRRAIDFFRALRGFKRRLAETIDQLARATEDIDARVAALSESSARLQARLDRLSSSLERAGVLAAAARDVRDAVGKVRAGMPRK